MLYRFRKKEHLFTRMKKWLFFLPVLFLSVSAFAQSVITSSSVTFTARNLGISVNGTIGGLKADIRFKPDNLQASSIGATVDVNTLNTDNSERDAHLREDEFFDVAHYPQITLKSISFKHRGSDKYLGKFNLTIKNKTRQVDIPFTYTESNGTQVFKGSFKINRLDYGVGGSSLILSNDISISISVEAKS